MARSAAVSPAASPFVGIAVPRLGSILRREKPPALVFNLGPGVSSSLAASYAASRRKQSPLPRSANGSRDPFAVDEERALDALSQD
jgi:hypothetical protein